MYFYFSKILNFNLRLLGNGRTSLSLFLTFFPRFYMSSSLKFKTAKIYLYILQKEGWNYQILYCSYKKNICFSQMSIKQKVAIITMVFPIVAPSKSWRKTDSFDMCYQEKILITLWATRTTHNSLLDEIKLNRWSNIEAKAKILWIHNTIIRIIGKDSVA